MENGINIFELPLAASGLNPDLIYSENFAYGIVDRCGHLQKALTVYVRDGETTTLRNGRRIITPPALVGELIVTIMIVRYSCAIRRQEWRES